MSRGAGAIPFPDEGAIRQPYGLSPSVAPKNKNGFGPLAIAQVVAQEWLISRLDQSSLPRAMSAHGTLLIEPPREPFGATKMARRRGQQKGHVNRQGNAWYLAFREDALDECGNVVRVRRNERIADAKEVSKREAQRIARAILIRVDEQAQRPS